MEKIISVKSVIVGLAIILSKLSPDRGSLKLTPSAKEISSTCYDPEPLFKMNSIIWHKNIIRRASLDSIIKCIGLSPAQSVGYFFIRSIGNPYKKVRH